MLSVVLTDATAVPGHAPRDPARAPPRRPGTSSRSTATPAPTTRCSCSPRDGPARLDATTTPRPGPRSAAAVEAVARDLARQQARRRRGRDRARHVPGHRRGRRRGRARRRPGRDLVLARQGRGPRPGPELGPHRRRGGQRAPSPRRAVLEAAGLVARPRPGSRPGSRPRLDPDRLRIAIAGHLVYDGPRGGPGRDRQGRRPRGDGRRGGPDPAGPRARGAAPARPSAATSRRATSARTREYTT